MVDAMSGIEHLLTLARLYGEVVGIEQSTVSSRVFDDGKKLGAIEQGSDIQVRRLERAVQWFSDHWPADQEWPAGIARPAPTPTAKPEMAEAAQ
jgi:hypothetical protein